METCFETGFHPESSCGGYFFFFAAFLAGFFAAGFFFVAMQFHLQSILKTFLGFNARFVTRIFLAD
jgi:hypothetical protein